MVEIVKMKMSLLYLQMLMKISYIFIQTLQNLIKKYNTSFKNNIKIRYQDHVITSKYLDFDFIKNNILVQEM